MPNRRSPRDDGEYITSLARGLAVLRAFTAAQPEMTLSEVATRVKLNPAVTRRCLNTLEHLGYVARRERRFLLRPEVMLFASAYTDSMHLEEVVRPYLQEIRDTTGDSSSLAVLAEHDILYLVHVSTSRMVRLAAGAGTRFPAYATSLGRVLLANLDEPALATYLDAAVLRPLTEHTVTSPAALKKLLREIRRLDYAAVEDELDYGIVSVAVPIRDHDGRAIAAINCSTATSRVRRDPMIRERVPHLRAAARRIEDALRRFPALAHSIRR